MGGLMKKCLYLSLIIFGICISQCIAGKIIFGLTDKEKQMPNISWGPVALDLQVSISTKNALKRFNTNEPISSIVRFNNLSTNSFGIVMRNNILDNRDFSFSILSPSGKDVSPVFYEDYTGGSGILVYVPPHQINGFQFDINDICKFDEMGTYKIVMMVKNRVPGSNQLADVVSNPLYVTIIPAQKP
jgi:hypothetical protein